MSEPEKKPVIVPPKDVTRIPVKHIFFKDPMDHEGATMVSNTRCWREPEGATRWWTADFIPAWQTMEITFHRHNVDDVVEEIPVSLVKRWHKL